MAASEKSITPIYTFLPNLFHRVDNYGLYNFVWTNKNSLCLENFNRSRHGEYLRNNPSALNSMILLYAVVNTHLILRSIFVHIFDFFC